MTDLLDRAQALEEKEREHAIKRALSKQNDIEIVNDVRNGQVVRVCAECDEEISLMRIKVMPTAALCVDCQSALEARV